MSARWRLNDIPWSTLAPGNVEPELLAVVKAAAVVEANSADYVTYLHSIFAEDADFRAAATVWGEEEAQHGAALGEWAERIDPDFNFAASLARFRAGYRIPLGVADSVRGSLAAELLARCVVESGTCSFYSALRDFTRDPVLKHICHRIAQDEARHYRLFFEHGARYRYRQPMTLVQRLRVALGRVGEADDDELGYAFYSTNIAGLPAAPAYDRASCAGRYQRLATGMYGLRHVRTLVSMIGQAVGLNPARWPLRSAGRLGWWWLRWSSQRAAD